MASLLSRPLTITVDRMPSLKARYMSEAEDEVEAMITRAEGTGRADAADRNNELLKGVARFFAARIAGIEADVGAVKAWQEQRQRTIMREEMRGELIRAQWRIAVRVVAGLGAVGTAGAGMWKLIQFFA